MSEGTSGSLALQAAAIAGEIVTSLALAEVRALSVRSDDELAINSVDASVGSASESDFAVLDLSRLTPAIEEMLDAIESDRADRLPSLLTGALSRSSSYRVPVFETILHAVIPTRFVLTIRSIGGDTIACSADGQNQAKKVLPDSMWVPFDEGWRSLVGSLRAVFPAASGPETSATLFVQNLGMVIAAQSSESLTRAAVEADRATRELVGDASPAEVQPPTMSANGNYIRAVLPYLRGLTFDGRRAHFVTLIDSHEARDHVKALDDTSDTVVPTLTYMEASLGGPSAIVLRAPKINLKDSSKSIVERFGESWRRTYDEFVRMGGAPPAIVAIEGLGIAALAPTYREVESLRQALERSIVVRSHLKRLGGPHFPKPFLARQVHGAQKELSAFSARLAAAFDVASPKTDELVRSDVVADRVCVVTGGAQGFGERFVRNLAASGALVFVADLNEAGATALANEVNGEMGRTVAIPVVANIANETSVVEMLTQITRTAGGLDLFVSNAGVVKAGSVKEIEQKDFEWMSSVNYTGFFLCVKQCARLLEIQNAPTGAYFTDIVQINSKSGLEGSNKNGAYAGSKFGGIGLTQSFALELVEDNIKVNSICPGNYLEGPLWSDPEKGVFVQYLKTGKVPGAKTTDDVRRFYESKVPMKRGCRGEDVVRAIYYIVDQKYETGQAVPVTGGQIMLK